MITKRYLSNPSLINEATEGATSLWQQTMEAQGRPDFSEPPHVDFYESGAD